jgi:hypothetical protein
MMSQLKLNDMTKRLQVILQDPKYQEIQRAARSRRMSVAEWVRQALARAPAANRRATWRKSLQPFEPPHDMNRRLPTLILS